MKAPYCYNLLAGTLLVAGFASAQGTFTSGSTGSDGALDYSKVAAGTYTFDPTTCATAPCAFTAPLDPSGDNIFNFTTINIPLGVTVNLTNTLLRGKPVVWLASGAVTIAGSLILDGGGGANLASFGAEWITYRVPSQPGPGGFPGGVGARPGTPALPGLGPGGGPVQTSVSCPDGGGGAFATVAYGTPAGSIYGNIWTVPLIGGSGGSGGCVAPTVTATDASGATGGAGGGAIRIVSTASISVTGKITANGGGSGSGRSGGGAGGSGSGGAINLIAPVISGNGQLTAQGGQSGGPGGNGYILLNVPSSTYTGYVYPAPTIKGLIAPPLPTPTTVPTVTINSVNGVNVPQPPQGAYTPPDVTINAATSVTINITAVGVPVGTVVQLNVQSELGPDQAISCNPLAGTLATSTATCSASFPTSVSRILASASW
jgi:hypothetical protein